METVIKAVCIYLLVLGMTRLSGRRTLAQVSVFDLVLVLLVAETAQDAMVGDDPSFTNVAILMGTLILCDVLFSFAKGRSRWLHRVIDGVPTVLVRSGVVDDEALRLSRVSRADILEAARTQQGLRTLDDIDFAILETSGTISILPIRQT